MSPLNPFVVALLLSFEKNKFYKFRAAVQILRVFLCASPLISAQISAPRRCHYPSRCHHHAGQTTYLEVPYLEVVPCWAWRRLGFCLQLDSQMRSVVAAAFEASLIPRRHYRYPPVCR